jgi:NADPH2:quinone reductase
VPGASVAGRVVSVGADVSPDWLGRAVITRTAGGSGGNAERAAAEVDALIPVPAGLDLADAAALLDDGATALALVEGAGTRAGDWVLVEAAAGGVGSLLVQLARAVGARVVGAARGGPKLDLVRSLGAEAVVDYSVPGWPRRVREATGGHGADVVFDGVGGQVGAAAFEAAAPGARFSVHGAASGSVTVIDPALARERGVTVIGLEQLQAFGTGGRAHVERMLAEAAAGTVRPVVGQTFPLERAADAHAAMEARGAIGKTLLRM